MGNRRQEEVLAIWSDAPAIRLVVVDDEPDVETMFRLRFRREIRSGQLELTFFTNPELALASLQEHSDVEVLITDLNMPEMHGLELLERVQGLNRPLKVIVVTAYGDLSNIRAAMMHGAFDFQVKPFDAKDLKVTIAKAVSLVRELRAGSDAAERAMSLEERNRFIEKTFGRYVSEEVKRVLLSSPEGEGRSERRVVTILMADIRGFSRLVGEHEPETSVAVLNRYFEQASSVILARNGTINEILGDGLLVLFGAPLVDEHAPEHAARAALELQMAMAELNERNRELGLPTLEIGIGIHTGEAVVGTIGSSTRQKYAAVGSHVNLTARIESQTVGGQILISETTARALGADAVLGEPRDVHFKGSSGHVQIVELLGMRGGEEPPSELATQGHDLQELVPPPSATIALIVNSKLDKPHAARVLALSGRAVRVDTELALAPFDDVAIEIDGRSYLAKVQPDSESGRGHVAVFTSVPKIADVESQIAR
ncbi:adenylate/guanylate cyclase domain-containing protein [Mycobacterium spongiae]|uniref:Response regulator n=1 Tax=Mycobacterium spongiae TaxID=886343 RepID=A0A975K130_9MYCO|nr:adenylate/guanylate cyclase domain-containing response regulator [Mycobacterium spongiae]QUR68734.1 response regulator [Mycobacterium spongiae]